MFGHKLNKSQIAMNYAKAESMDLETRRQTAYDAVAYAIEIDAEDKFLCACEFMAKFLPKMGKELVEMSILSISSKLIGVGRDVNRKV